MTAPRCSFYVPPHIEPPDRQLPFFKALHRAFDNPMEAWPRAVYEQRSYVPPRRDFPTVFISDPDAIDIVLRQKAELFPKSKLTGRMLRPLLGGGVMTAEGDRWRWQRRAAAPSFQAARIKANGSVMAEAAEAALARWRKLAPGAAVEITAEMIRITFDIILDTLLGGPEEVDAAEMSRQITIYMNEIGRPGVADVLGLPMGLRNVLKPEGARAVRFLQGAIDDMLARWRQDAPDAGFLSQLLRAHDPDTGRAMSDVDLRDNLLTFWAAGHETTAVALTWALFLLARDDIVAQRVRGEVAREAGEAPITADIAARLVFTKQVVQEAMRLYPPVPLMTRQCLQDTDLGPVAVHKGDIVVIPIYAIHRHRLYWQEPDAFDPDRFAPAAGLDRRRYLFMPFGAGPRVCIGAAFAQQEAVIVLASLVRGARFEAVDAAVRPLFRITMRPEGGLRMRIALAEPAQPPSASTKARLKMQATYG